MVNFSVPRTPVPSNTQLLQSKPPSFQSFSTHGCEISKEVKSSVPLYTVETVIKTSAQIIWLQWPLPCSFNDTVSIAFIYGGFLHSNDFSWIKYAMTWYIMRPTFKTCPTEHDTVKFNLFNRSWQINTNKNIDEAMSECATYKWIRNILKWLWLQQWIVLPEGLGTRLYSKCWCYCFQQCLLLQVFSSSAYQCYVQWFFFFFFLVVVVFTSVSAFISSTQQLRVYQ